MMKDEFILVERVPSAQEFQRLHEAVGWSNVDLASTQLGLGNSLFSVCLMCRDRVVGCGRVVGDGGIYFYIQDVIVLPEYQGRGLGRRIMDAIMGYLATHAQPNAFVGLMAAVDVSGFYERYGFTERPADRPGMCRIWGR